MPHVITSHMPHTTRQPWLYSVLRHVCCHAMSAGLMEMPSPRHQATNTLLGPRFATHGSDMAHGYCHCRRRCASLSTLFVKAVIAGYVVTVAVNIIRVYWQLSPAMSLRHITRRHHCLRIGHWRFTNTPRSLLVSVDGLSMLLSVVYAWRLRSSPSR